MRILAAEDNKTNRLVFGKMLKNSLDGVDRDLLREAVGRVTSVSDRTARLVREAQSLARFNHANIATIYAVDEVTGDDGEPVMTILLPNED